MLNFYIYRVFENYISFSWATSKQFSLKTKATKPSKPTGTLKPSNTLPRLLSSILTTTSSIQTDLYPTSITNNTNRPFKMPRSAFSTYASIQNKTRLAQGIPTQRHCFVLSRKTWLGPWNIQGRAQVRSQQCGTSQKYQGNWVQESRWWTSWGSWRTRWRPQCHDADVHEVNE